ncbi:MAG: nucleotidyl transferase AbiEii/AbiGii toxin family protein [Lactobacillus sp.]|nr:nucleotidyl transferase AbiEii/AbiGii toxin family protein [Lactobacillus sp.]
MSHDKKYPGVSVILKAKIKNTKTPVKIDLGFGDVVHPDKQELQIPTQLGDFVSPLVSSYPIETIIAEKVDAILDLMEFSSRMKDYYDLYPLSTFFEINQESLRTALVKTFANRDRNFDKEALRRVLAFDQNEEMQRKWNTYLRKTELPATELTTVLSTIDELIGPFWDSLYPDSPIAD